MTILSVVTLIFRKKFDTVEFSSRVLKTELSKLQVKLIVSVLISVIWFYSDVEKTLTLQLLGLFLLEEQYLIKEFAAGARKYPFAEETFF